MPERPVPAVAESPSRARSASRSGARPTARDARARAGRGLTPPVLVEVRRGAIVESRHRGHVAQVDADGLLERGVGDPDVEVTLRSAVKPFTLVALVESGAADDLQLSQPELAIMAASHNGEDMHVRTLHAVFRRAGLSQSVLACGSETPHDARTAARLARDGEEPGAIRHQCSGFHAASVLLSRHAGWPIEGYDSPDHPSQVAARAAVARVFGVRPEALRTAVDDCGLETYAFPLVEVARAFALLADPSSADGPRASAAPALRRIRDAMLAAPELVEGTDAAPDTRLMRARPGLLVAKTGAEGLRGVGLLPGARGEGTPAAGMAVRIEDGDRAGRANPAVTVEALAQLGVLEGAVLRSLGSFHRPVTRSPQREVIAEAVPSFELAPLSEMVSARGRH